MAAGLVITLEDQLLREHPSKALLTVLDILVSTGALAIERKDTGGVRLEIPAPANLGPEAARAWASKTGAAANALMAAHVGWSAKEMK